ncbi:hypothetical protein [Corallococcus sp. AB045]|uniref:hypothetical protein n=1 Tax=Corallococcus sp. AB045 TaxID=2316719 RepID=UPI001F278C42|nr:hypothetical protein [Corallococcus sp. AB045]
MTIPRFSMAFTAPTGHGSGGGGGRTCVPGHASAVQAAAVLTARAMTPSLFFVGFEGS